jgi:hypothetical protein
MMRRITATLTLLLVALAVQGCAFVDNDTSVSNGVEGTYYVNGVDPGGTEYGGQLIITKTGTNQYDMDWIVTGSIQSGSGRFNGDVLDAEWRTVEGLRESSGTARYEIQEDGSLIGERFESRFDEAGYEEAFPVELK